MLIPDLLVDRLQVPKLVETSKGFAGFGNKARDGGNFKLSKNLLSEIILISQEFLNSITH